MSDRKARLVTFDNDSSFLEVGERGVTELIYHEPLGEGDRHYVDSYFDNGEIVRHFNFDSITIRQGE